MPAKRISRATLELDQKILEAALSGLLPAQIAAELNITEDEVRASERRTQARMAALPQADAERLDVRNRAKALYNLAVQHYQQSRREPDEISHHSVIIKGQEVRDGKPDPASPGAADSKIEHTKRARLGDTRFLRIALHALEFLRDPPPPAAPAPAVPDVIARALKAHDEQIRAAGRKHPELFAKFHHAQQELLCGGPLPLVIDFNDPKYDPQMPEEQKELIRQQQRERKRA